MFSRAEAFEDFLAVEFGEHDIEENEIVVVESRPQESVLAVGFGLDGVAFLLKSRLQDVAEVAFVFDDENLHGELFREIVT